MARYIDADALIEMLNIKAKTDEEMGLYNHLALTQSFITFVERQPTADVVPKSELEIWKQNRFNIFQSIECYDMTRKKVAREIFEDIEESCVVRFGNTHVFDTDRFDELKKKYSEEE